MSRIDDYLGMLLERELEKYEEQEPCPWCGTEDDDCNCAEMEAMLYED